MLCVQPSSATFACEQPDAGVHRSSTWRGAAARRGVAMLLVLISLMMATILSVSYLASRDNSSAIGENVANSAAARWASESGLEMGITILQTEADWRNAPEGKIIDDLAFGSAVVDIDVVDLATSAAPNQSTVNVRLTATANVDGVEQQSSAVAYVPVMEDLAADVDLSEFAIFGADSIELTDNAVVTRWATAPLSTLGRPVALATRATSVGAVGVYNSAATIDSAVFCGPSASDSLIDCTSGYTPARVRMLDVVPMPKSPKCGEPAPSQLSLLELLLMAVLKLVGGLGLINTDTRASTVEFSGNTVRTLRGPMSLVSNDDVIIQNSKVFIEGQVKIVAFDDFLMTNGAIELKPGARLTIFVADAVNLQDSYIGDVRSNTVRDNTGSASPMNSDRIKIFRIPEYTQDASWELRANSVVKASVYGKAVNFRIRGTSALYGRVAAQEVSINEDGALFYQPSLDSRTGYTTAQGPLYGSDGRLKNVFTTLSSLDYLSLRAAADTGATDIQDAQDETYKHESATDVDATPAVVAPTEPTPRSVPVEHKMASYGNGVDSWEQ